MQNNNETQGKPKGAALRKIVTVVLVLVILGLLVWAARTFVGSVDVVELLKRIHGG